MKENNSTITVNPDSVVIKEGLFFMNKKHQNVVSINNPNNKREVIIKYNYIIGQTPKWYQLKEWWKLARLIKKHCP